MLGMVWFSIITAPETFALSVVCVNQILQSSLRKNIFLSTYDSSNSDTCTCALDDTINDISKKFICDIQEAGARWTKNPWLANIKKLE